MNIDFEEGLRQITSSSSRLTTEIGSHILDAGGKRLRPRLVLLIGEALGLRQDKILPMAYSVELIHTASLLHDDVVDATAVRRSRPTANNVYGDKAALLAGDFLSATAISVALSNPSMELIGMIANTIRKMAEGELRQIEQTKRFHTDVNEYLDIIYLKTAVLFELCTLSPGIIAGLPAEQLEGVREFGRCIGMAFQIVDDIINLAPLDSDDKDAFNDILECKSTLPLIYLFEEDPTLPERLAAMQDPEDWKAEILPRLHAGLFAKSRAKAQSYLDKGIAELESVQIINDELRDLPSLVLLPVKDRF